MNSIRSVIQQFLVYKGRCDAKPRGRTKQIFFLEDGGGWRKGKNDVVSRVGRREFGTSLDFDRKKYLGRGQLRDTAWPLLNGNDMTNHNIQSYPDTRENNWQRVKSLQDVQLYLSLLHYHYISQYLSGKTHKAYQVKLTLMLNFSFILIKQFQFN